MEVFLPALLAVLIGAVHFFGEEIDELTGKYNFFLVSFSAGFTLAYFFAVLIPETSKHSVFGIENLSILIGLAVFYVLEELVYQRDQNFGEVKYKFKEIHTIFVGLYYTAVGTILFFLNESSMQQLLLFFIPVMIHTSVNSLAMKEMHEEMLENKIVQIIISLTTLTGVMIGYLLDIPVNLLYTLLGVLGGSFIYIVVHDALDPRRERPLGFIAGITVFLVLLSLII